MDASALDVLVYCSVTVIAAVNGTSSSLPLTVVLIALLVWQTARDLRKRIFLTGLALAFGLAISLAVTLPGVVAGSVLDCAQLVIPASILIALFVYGISVASIKISEQARGSRIEETASVLTFPLLWATSWAIFCRVNSLARLITWTPLREFGPFYPMASAFGMPGLDLLVALMAVAVIELLGGLQFGSQETGTLIEYDDRNERSHLLPPSEQYHQDSLSQSKSGRNKFRCILLSAFFFVWWSMGGVVTSNANSQPSHVEATKIACVLPHSSSQRGRLALSDYMLESEIVSGRGAKILQWPEAAVHLTTIPDKIEFAANLESLSLRRRAFLGTSYTFQDEDDPERSSIFSTMFGPQQEIVYTYAKQALVPVAETYRFVPGRSRLPRKTIFVPEARQKGRAIPLGHNITVSTAICHDTSFDHIVRQAYPASLVLVPSSVYSERVAWTRINQLRANARALSTAILVCDGNKESISAFIDRSGNLRYWQKGAGSFEITAPLVGRARTAYGAYGDVGSIGILFACLLACAALEMLVRLGLSRIYNLYHQAREAFRHRFQGHYSTRTSAQRDQAEDLL